MHHLAMRGRTDSNVRPRRGLPFAPIGRPGAWAGRRGSCASAARDDGSANQSRLRRPSQATPHLARPSRRLASSKPSQSRVLGRRLASSSRRSPGLQLGNGRATPTRANVTSLLSAAPVETVARGLATSSRRSPGLPLGNGRATPTRASATWLGLRARSVPRPGMRGLARRGNGTIVKSRRAVCGRASGPTTSQASVSAFSPTPAVTLAIDASHRESSGDALPASPKAATARACPRSRPSQP
jgi:hypothetical protein